MSESMIGGKREGAGRPAPLGRKVPVGIRLTPDVMEFCRQHPDGFTILEAWCLNSKEFRAWKAHRVTSSAPTAPNNTQSPGKSQRRES